MSNAPPVHIVTVPYWFKAGIGKKQVAPPLTSCIRHRYEFLRRQSAVFEGSITKLCTRSRRASPVGVQLIPPLVVLKTPS